MCLYIYTYVQITGQYGSLRDKLVKKTKKKKYNYNPLINTQSMISFNIRVVQSNH